jgi:undecaprenyl-diphosphatase
MPFVADEAPSRRAWLVAGAVVVVSVAVFLLIAEDLLDGGGLISHDHSVLGWFVENRTDTWISVARAVSTMGSFPVLFGIGVVGFVLLWRHGTSLVLAAAPALALCLASLTSTLAKSLFGRDRPPVEVRAVTVSLEAFPSGHAANSAAFFLAWALVLGLAVVTGRLAKLALVAAAAVLAGCVGISRLVLGVHWLSDVVAGWALGTAIAVVVVMAAWWLAVHRTAVLRAALPDS